MKTIYIIVFQEKDSKEKRTLVLEGTFDKVYRIAAKDVRKNEYIKSITEA